VTTRTLSSGLAASLVPDEHGLELRIDGIAQSHIGPADSPPRHASTRWVLAAALELLRAAGVGGSDRDRDRDEAGVDAPRDETAHRGPAGTDDGPTAGAGTGDGPAAGAGLAALHLGGCAATLPRLLQHALPALRQRVVELEPALVELIAEEAPLPPGIDPVVGDGRAALERVEAPVSLVTTDVFGGGSVPAPFTSVEFYAAARAALRPGGGLIVNSADGPPLRFIRGQLATLRSVFPHVALISTGSTLAGARFSNIVLLAADRPLPLEAIRARLRGERPPVAVLDWRRLSRFVADTRPEPVTDATAIDSPAGMRSAYLGSAALPPSLTAPLDDGSCGAAADASVMPLRPADVGAPLGGLSPGGADAS
jgi:hypothetical protein